MVRVNWRVSLGYTGVVLRWMAAALLLPFALAVASGEDVVAFGATIALSLLGSVALERYGRQGDIDSREAILLVSLVWTTVGIVGALPYVLAGTGTVATPVNALFESVSGFTTTGATVMAEVSTDTHSRAIMMWRQESQWLGGMGIVVLAVALFPNLSVGGVQLVEREAPGPRMRKLTPKLAETARVLWKVYVLVTATEIALLYALHLGGFAPDMSLYLAVAHGFTTMATGGFSPAARSIAAFSTAVQWVIVPFMAAAGVNFALFSRAYQGDLDAFRDDPEFRTYLGVLVAVAVVLVGVLFANGDYAVGAAVRHGVFQAVSIVTTTGYASVDFNAWSETAQTLLVLAMFLGGSAGSTGSAIKIVRWLIVGKSIVRTLFTTAHPSALRSIRIGETVVKSSTVRDVHTFTLLYVVLFFAGSVLVLANGTTVGHALTVQESMSAAAATLGNVGPGVDFVGPMRNYLHFPTGTKLLLAAFMILGRLEILTILVLFTRGFWRG
ncbi:TrkH family potassium uptake protein [Salinirarus marinus]|uniref:TrkH family potassium uptake protein n=1 Tax=Salinirarus marinus TaxID=3068310 RepID=UPI003C6C0016